MDDCEKNDIFTIKVLGRLFEARFGLIRRIFEYLKSLFIRPFKFQLPEIFLMLIYNGIWNKIHQSNIKALIYFKKNFLIQRNIELIFFHNKLFKIKILF